MGGTSFIVFLYALVALLGNADGNVFSCGGFVKSSIPIDYSKITVKLLTPEGHLKHEEELNPQNGYFMIPVYSKGQYSLRVSSPDGYFFEPELYSFKLDGVDDPCSKNEDIIFNLNGFSISGVVDGADAGLPLILSKNGVQVDKAVTQEGGGYQMKAPPGKYEVSTGPGASKCISRGKTSVEVTDKPVVVLPNLRISGHQLDVVVSTGKTPLAGIQISLFSVKEPELSNCKKITSPENDVAIDAKFECFLGETAANGRLNIPCLPSGQYYLQAAYKYKKSWLKFNPSVQKIDVVNSKVEVKFDNIGVSVRGRVLVNNKPMANVDVTADGKKFSVTNKDGYYLLNDQKEGALVVSAVADKTIFNVVKVPITFQNLALPDVIVEKFQVCGSVENDGSNNVLVLKAKEGDKIISVRPDSSGQFCSAVSPGRYTLSPAESTSSLTPRILEIDVSEKPATGLRFTNFKTEAEVRVVCIEECSSATVSLLLGGNVVKSAKGTDVFIFKDIGPGNYKARIDDDGRGCWKSREVDLIVERQKPAPVELVRNGFSSRLRISHPAKITWVHSEDKKIRGEVETKGGLVTICVPVQATYQISLASCYTFQRDQFEVTVPSESVNEENAVAARISGVMKSSDNPTVTIKIRSSAGERKILVSAGTFSFDEPLSSTGESLIIVPASQTHLFEPTSATIQFNGHCVPKAAEFTAAKGTFIDGVIRPPVANVKISAKKISDPRVVFDAVSDDKGNYKLGPVRKTDELQIEATLDGYKFVPGLIPGAFDSVKLSQLSITIKDERTKEPLDGVLLSVVGSGDYRSNNHLDSSAHINFVGLAPGDYYVRAILQEYKFAPSTSTIKIKEGQHENIVLEGRRVSYSVIGKIREMSGSGVADVVIEALSDGCDQHQSEAVSNAAGGFRVRGLLPNCNYRIYAKSLSDGTSAPHSFPLHFNVAMTAGLLVAQYFDGLTYSEDVKNLEFIATTIEQTTDVAVEIDMSGVRDVQSVRVSVSKGHELVRSTVLQQPVNLFYLSHLPRDGAEYSVRVEADRPPQGFTAKTVFFSTDAPVRVVRVPLSSMRKAGEIEISIGNFLSLPFFVFLGFAFFNQSRTIELLRSFLEMLPLPQNSAQLAQRKRK